MMRQVLNNEGTNNPALFGISGRSNRDGRRRTHWGKNEFNSSFPAALICYMKTIHTPPIFLRLNESFQCVHSFIEVDDLFCMNPFNENTYFSFEDTYVPHQQFINGQLPRSDIVIMDRSVPAAPWKRGIEIKLTALPDNTTCSLTEDRYSCEMVFRPTAIVHLALSIAGLFRDRRDELQSILNPACSAVFNWRDRQDILRHIDTFISALQRAFTAVFANQEPFVVQPVWKTLGKKACLSDNCLDVFVWSNLAFAQMIIDLAGEAASQRAMIRPARCICWLVRMLYDFSQIGVLNPSLITSEMAYELQTDKAFAISGVSSWKYLGCDALRTPRIRKDQIKNIILGGGQNLLSPERRFDAIIVNTPNLFD